MFCFFIFCREKRIKTDNMEKWHTDLGYDEIRENWFGHYILDSNGNIVCQVFGRTVADCDIIAERIIETNYEQ